MADTPKRIQRKRTRGWKMPEGCVYVGRGTIWGNPFKVGAPSGVFHAPYGLNGQDETMIEALSLEQCLEMYRDLIMGFISPEMFPHGHDWHKTFKRKTHGAHPKEWAWSALKGHDLACWCPVDSACHADILLEITHG